MRCERAVRAARCTLHVVVLLLGRATIADAQDEAAVEAIAPLLAAEDRREWVPGLFQRSLEDANPLVRRTASMTIGRLRDPRGTAMLLDRLTDPDSSVQTTALFALGLIGDSAAVGRIIDRFGSQPALAVESALEAITALAKIGGSQAATFFSSLLRGGVVFPSGASNLVRERAALELWRLGPAAHGADLIPLATDTGIPVRVAAVYSLARLRVRAAAPQLLTALRDEVNLVRAYAARALTRAYADSAGIPEEAVVSALRRALTDAAPEVRINVMRTLGTYRASDLSKDLVPFLEDQDANVRVQAAATLGFTGGPVAVAALRDVLRSRAVFAVRREALLSLARADSASLQQFAPAWGTSTDWRERALLAEAWAGVPGVDAGSHIQAFLDDPDSRVVAAALQAWAGAEAEPDAGLVRAARQQARHADAAVRSLAADVLARVKRAEDISLLVTLYRASERDSFPDAALSVLAALDSVARQDSAAAQRVRSEFLDVVPRPKSYLLRRWAEAAWPEAAARWGPGYPIETTRTLQDYRELARRYVVGVGPLSHPHVIIEIEQRGSVELELFGPEAPLTVANFLMLVDRHFFDGNRWHRVVPNFVVQDGDPRGDGWGGPGGEIRDEINRRRYEGRVLGMALSGPDTGSSQWFITLSPQPHLDGSFTVFGRVVGNGVALTRITQGDVIRTIRRG